MKKLIFTVALSVAAVATTVAQSEMKSVWEAKLEHRAEENDLDEESGNIISSNEKEMTLIDANTGKVKWSKSFKEMSNGLLKKVDERIPMWEAKAIFLFDKKSMGKDQMAVIDAETGKMLWSTDKYSGVTAGSIAYISELDMFAVANKKAFSMIKARTGEELWETQGFKGALGKYLYDANTQTITAFNYNPTAEALGGIGSMLANFGVFKSQLYKINVKNGEIIWTTDLKGNVEREIKTRKIVGKLKLINDDKIMVTVQGVQMFDYKTGALLWGVVHDQSVLEESRRGIGAGFVGRKMIKSAVYGAVAEPLIDGNEIYVFDMQNKRNQYVNKYDLNTGKLLWKSKELKKLTIAPNMYKVGNRLIIQIGGWAEVQGIVEEKSSMGGLGGFGSGATISTYSRVKFFKEFAPFGVEALDATNGEFVWRSERFARGVTNAFLYDSKLIVASGKELYSLNPDDGKENYEVSVRDNGIKGTEQIFNVGSNAILVCSKGVASHSCSDGKSNWVVPTKRGDLTGVYNNMAFYETERNDQVVIDLSNGKFTTYDARKGAKTEVYNDGQYIVVFEKDKVTKLKTKE